MFSRINRSQYTHTYFLTHPVSGYCTGWEVSFILKIWYLIYVKTAKCIIISFNFKIVGITLISWIDLKSNQPYPSSFITATFLQK